MAKRTITQNSAMHKYFEMLADALNDAGLDMRATLKPDVEIPWTPEMVKEHIWRPIQRLMVECESTTELDKMQVSEIYEVIHRHMASKHGISVPFPCEDDRIRNSSGRVMENCEA